jgi:Flp pilus assembly protein TadD
MSLLARLLRRRQPESSRRTDAGEAPSPSQRDARLAIIDVRDTGARANALNDRGDFAEALRLVDEARVIAPDDPDLVTLRASTLYEWGRIHEARRDFRKAQALGAKGILFWLNLGWTQLLEGSVEAAVAAMQAAVDASVGSRRARFGLGVALGGAGRPGDALAQFRAIVESDPADFDAVLQSAGCLLDLGDVKAAELQYLRAVDLRPTSAAAWSNLGAVYTLQDRYDDALKAFERADELEAQGAEDVDNFVNLAVAYADGGAVAKALSVYEQHLPSRPSPRGMLGYASALLRAGRFAEGWVQYESRWLCEPYRSVRARFGQPPWNGQDLRNRTILLHAEQGFGDTIQLLRYAPLVKALGATVVLLPVPGIEDLAQRMDGIDHVLRDGDAFPAFDYYAYLFDLPRIFPVELGNMPGRQPYVRVDAARAAAWAARMRAKPGRKIGVAWAGNPRHERDRFRSIPTSALTRLAAIDGTCLVSLQKGRDRSVANAFTEALWDVTDELHSFEDTAALIDTLDLVIAVDTSVLHLAGAMGKPVWALLPAPCDFRWLEAREDSPWYPTMRIFRQSARNDWPGVVDRVIDALGDSARTGPKGLPVGGAIATGPSLRLSATGTQPGFFVVSQTRHGLLLFRPDDDPVGRALHVYGEHLEDHVALVSRIVSRGSVVLEADVGIGAHAVAIASIVGPEGHLFAYESDSIMRRVLRQNLNNVGANNVTVMRRRLTTRPEQAVPTDARNADPIHRGESIDELRLERLDLLKLNEPSTAFDALLGAVETLQRLRPSLLVGAADAAALRALADVGRSANYRCYRLCVRLFNRVNFYECDADVFDGRESLSLVAIPHEAPSAVLPGCEMLD